MQFVLLAGNFVSLILLLIVISNQKKMLKKMHTFQYDKSHVELRFKAEKSALEAKVYAYEQASWHLGFKIAENLNRGNITAPILPSEIFGYALLGFYQASDGEWKHVTYSHFVKRELDSRGIKSSEVHKYNEDGDAIVWSMT